MFFFVLFSDLNFLVHTLTNFTIMRKCHFCLNKKYPTTKKKKPKTQQLESARMWERTQDGIKIIRNKPNTITNRQGNHTKTWRRELTKVTL